MSDRGVFAVDRGIFTDDLFADEAFTEREAWLWLIAEAAWKARRVRAGTAAVELARGQLCHSVRFMAEAWQWSKSRVDRFLSKLEKRDAISRTGGTATAIITVCRYDEFQRVALPERDSDGTGAGTDLGQQRDKRESIKTLNPFGPNENSDASKLEQPDKENTAEPAPRQTRKRITYPGAFEALWKAYPTDPNMSKSEALKEWLRLDDDDRAAAFRSVPSFKSWIATQHNYRVVHLERFLKTRRFDGFAPKVMPKADPGALDPLLASFSDDRWRNEVRRWRDRRGDWPPFLQSKSPPPDDPRTKVPPHILAELNIHPARSRAA